MPVTQLAKVKKEIVMTYTARNLDTGVTTKVDPKEAFNADGKPKLKVNIISRVDFDTRVEQITAQVEQVNAPKAGTEPS